ncbi:hypothetical protein ACR2R6_23200 (plasmid) [Methylocaldum gracile subsp. desertum]|uniref:hypothetical protein n=1 Tax=Methylocaldum sp. GT1BW TaxID=3438964 RepID=UPI003D9FBBDF
MSIGKKPSDWQETENPERDGAFVEDALTEADAEESIEIPEDHYLDFPDSGKEV